MDFSLIDYRGDGFGPSTSVSRANFVTLGPTVPSIYPSLRLDEELAHYDELKVKSVDGDDNEMITSRDLSPGAVLKDAQAQGPIELDSVKHKLSSFWTNVKYGKSRLKWWSARVSDQ